MTTKKTITLQQIGSPIRRPKVQRLYLLSLGLRRMRQTVTVVDSPSVRGLIRKAGHMLKIIP